MRILRVLKNKSVLRKVSLVSGAPFGSLGGIKREAAWGKVSSGNCVQVERFEGIQKRICMGKSEFRE